jgi:hypothetical protein
VSTLPMWMRGNSQLRRHIRRHHEPQHLPSKLKSSGDMDQRHAHPTLKSVMAARNHPPHPTLKSVMAAKNPLTSTTQRPELQSSPENCAARNRPPRPTLKSVVIVPAKSRCDEYTTDELLKMFDEEETSRLTL